MARRRRPAGPGARRSGARSLASLPIFPGAWEADVIPLRELLPTVPPEIATAELVLCAEQGSGLVLGMRLEASGEGLAALPDAVRAAIVEPAAGDPRRPRRLLVRSDGAAAALGTVLSESGVTVETSRRLPAIDEAAAHLAKGLARFDVEEHRFFEESVPPAAIGDLFEAAREYYAAAPWKTIGGDQPLEIRIGDADSCWVTVMGAGGIEYGLGIHRSARALAEMLTGDADADDPGDLLGITYISEAEAPDELREMRRTERWPIAGPSAFPALIRHSATGGIEPASIDDVSDAVVAARGVVAFVEQHRRTLRAGRRCESRHEVRGIGGAPAQVHVIFPVLPPLASMLDAQSVALADGPADPAALAVEEVMHLARETTRSDATVRRLAWSFFRGPGPDYMGDDLEEVQFAVARFMEWAIFGPAAEKDGRTLAVRAVEEARQRLGEERYHELRAVATPAFSVFRVERVVPDTAFELLDLARGERLRLLSRPGHSGFHKGELMFGALFPAGDGNWIGGGAITSFDDRPADRFELPESMSGFAVLAPWLEAEFFGANNHWIADLDDEEFAAAFADFSRDLRLAGTRLPALSRLKRRVTQIDDPMQFVQEAMGKTTWWSIDEANVFAAFLMRLWNRTPRTELGGRSPEQMRELEKQRGRKPARRPRPRR